MGSISSDDDEEKKLIIKKEKKKKKKKDSSSKKKKKKRKSKHEESDNEISEKEEEKKTPVVEIDSNSSMSKDGHVVSDESPSKEQEEKEKQPSNDALGAEEAAHDGEKESEGEKNDHENTDNNTGGNNDETTNDGNDGPTKKKRKRKRKRKSNSTPDEVSKTKDNDNAASGGGDDGNDVSSSEITMEEKYSSLDHTVYVEGIPFDCVEDDVREFFCNNGCDDLIQIRLPKWQDTGRLRGYGHIVFNTTKSREKALSDLNGLHLRHRFLSIRPPNQPRQSSNTPSNATPQTQPTGCKTIFIKNLPYDCTEDEITNTFRPFGKIIEGGIRLARNYSTRQFKGFAYVEYKNPEGALAAVQRASKPRGIVVKGRCCFVDYETGKMKGSYRRGDGKYWQKEHGSVYKE